MSKPNLLGFATSVGFYRNKRIMDLERLLSRSLPGKIERSKMAPTLFQVTMAYAAENQIDGNFDGYTPADWSKIFLSNNVQVTPSEAAAIVKGFREVGLFDGDRIRSWMKYNRHLADYEGIVKRKRKAAKEMHKRREQEARERHDSPSNNGQDHPQNPEKIPSRTVPKAAEKGDGISRQLFELNQALEIAPTPKAKRELQKKKAELLAARHGVDLSAPAPASPARSAPATAPKKRSQAELDAELLTKAQSLLADFPDALREEHVSALLQAGHKLPSHIRSRFAKLQNPVPE